MTKAELIERYGIEWYEQCKAQSNSYQKERYQNDPEYRESKKARTRTFQINQPEYYKSYNKNDLNSSGNPKHNIRQQSQYILFNKRHHSRLNGYEIHHAFGYDDPNKFIYITKSLHGKIHQYLRDNNIDADSNHYDFIKYMINECEEYTYISV